VLSLMALTGAAATLLRIVSLVRGGVVRGIALRGSSRWSGWCEHLQAVSPRREKGAGTAQLSPKGVVMSPREALVC
jgi:hypothetical protein